MRYQLSSSDPVVNAIFMPGGIADCSAQPGWYYAGGERILLCPESCAAVLGSAQSTVEVDVGCPSDCGAAGALVSRCSGDSLEVSCDGATFHAVADCTASSTTCQPPAGNPARCGS